jgi:phage host-nuclease inhibitor protein Gam
LVRWKPSVGPYCSASAEEWWAILVICAANDSGGKVEVSGSPPASEITSGRAVISIRSRIAEERITRVRPANRAA